MAKSTKKGTKKPGFDEKLQRARRQFSDNLRYWLRRRRKGLRVDDNWPKALAELTGIGVTSAQRYLNPKKVDYAFPKLDQLILMADGLDISLNELLAEVYYANNGHEEGAVGSVGGGYREIIN